MLKRWSNMTSEEIEQEIKESVEMFEWMKAQEKLKLKTTERRYETKK